MDEGCGAALMREQQRGPGCAAAPIAQELGIAGRPGWAVAAFFGYMKGTDNQLALTHVPEIKPRNDTLAGGWAGTGGGSCRFRMACVCVCAPAGSWVCGAGCMVHGSRGAGWLQY